jgi:hypothetical protein
MEEAAEPVLAADAGEVGLAVFRERAQGSGLCQCAVRPMVVVKSVRGAVPVFRPARFLGPRPNPPCGFHRNGLSVSPRWVCW